MLWLFGCYDQWDNFVQLLKIGYDVVKVVDLCIKVMLYIDSGGDNGKSCWWFDSVKQCGVVFDVIGLLYYL